MTTPQVLGHVYGGIPRERPHHPYGAQVRLAPGHVYKSCEYCKEDDRLCDILM